MSGFLARHYVFLPRLRHSLEEFTEQWNHHPLSTAENLSSVQLWTSGILENFNHISANGILSFEDEMTYGIDRDGPVPLDDDDYDIVVPRSTVCLSELQRHELAIQIDTLSDDGESGMFLHNKCAG